MSLPNGNPLGSMGAGWLGYGVERGMVNTVGKLGHGHACQEGY